MNIKITPTQIEGKVKAITSKSHAHRLLMADALSKKSTEIILDTTSIDIEATKACMKELKNETPILNCEESGSTLRFLLPVTMAMKEEATFLGKGRLPQRPISPLKEEMEAKGCKFTHGGKDNEICTIKGKLTSGTYTLAGNISSQYITGLLFALPMLDGPSQIKITTKLESKSYVDITLKVLKDFGVEIGVTEEEGLLTYHVTGNQTFEGPNKINGEGDWSNSGFWLCAGMLTEKADGITLTNLSLDSTQGDKAVIEILKEMGANIKIEENQITVKKGNRSCVEIDAMDIPDLVPILSVVASVTPGITTVKNVARLRIKESDRLEAICQSLNALGGKLWVEDETLYIEGVKALKGGKVQSYNDHRMVMSMAVASIVSQGPIEIENWEAINKSYPHFFEDFKKLGGQTDVI